MELARNNKPRIVFFSDGNIMYKMPFLDNDSYYKYPLIKDIAIKWLKLYREVQKNDL